MNGIKPSTLTTTITVARTWHTCTWYNMDFITLIQLLSTLQNTVVFAQARHLLPTQKVCPNCGHVCSLQNDKAAIDGMIFRCLRRRCRKKLSIRNGTFFQNSHLKLRDILCLMFNWCYKIGVTTAMSLMSEHVSSSRTYVDYYSFFRDICSQYGNRHPVRLGGVGHIVQIDETHLGRKRKYNVGRVDQRLDIWVFGAVDCVTKKIHMEIVPDRKRVTLEAIIQRHVIVGSTIHSDKFASYFHLNALGYDHHTVNHSEEFVSQDGTHTQRIENLWGQLKANLAKMRGTSEGLIAGHIDEFLYRKNHLGDDIFSVFIQHIAELYPCI